MQPTFKILVDGKVIPKPISDRVQGIEITDERDFKSDSVTIYFNDDDYSIEMTPKMKTVQIWLGFDELQDLGLFKASGMKAGASGRMILRGTGFDTQTNLRTVKSRKFQTKNLYQIISEVFADYDIKVVAAPKFQTMELENPPIQQEEPDLSFTNRILRNFDATLKIDPNSLTIISKRESLKADGSSIEPVILDVNELDDWELDFKAVEGYEVAIAEIWDRDNSKDIKTVRATSVSGEGVYKFRQRFYDRTEALEACRSMLSRSMDKEGTLSFAIENNPKQLALRVMRPIEILNIPKNMAQGRWIVRSAVHTLSKGTLRTECVCVRKLPPPE